MSDMTRKEAIEQLENHAQYKLNGKDLEALEMAIKDMKRCSELAEFAQEYYSNVDTKVRNANEEMGIRE